MKEKTFRVLVHSDEDEVVMALDEVTYEEWVNLDNIIINRGYFTSATFEVG